MSRRQIWIVLDATEEDWHHVYDWAHGHEYRLWETSPQFIQWVRELPEEQVAAESYAVHQCCQEDGWRYKVHVMPVGLDRYLQEEAWDVMPSRYLAALVWQNTQLRVIQKPQQTPQGRNAALKLLRTLFPDPAARVHALGPSLAQIDAVMWADWASFGEYEAEETRKDQVKLRAMEAAVRREGGLWVEHVRVNLSDYDWIPGKASPYFYQWEGEARRFDR